MISEIQNKRKDLVNLLQEISFKKLENKYFIFEIEIYNPDTEINDNWYTIYQMKNKKLEFKYSAADEVEYGSLDLTESFTRTLKYLQKNNITQLNSLLGLNYKGHNLFGIDTKDSYYDEETGFDDYRTKLISKNDWWLNNMLQSQKIELNAPFQTPKNMLRYI